MEFWKWETNLFFTVLLVKHNECIAKTWSIVQVGFLPKVNDSKRSTTTGIMNDVLHDTLDVAVSFGIVDGSEPGGSLPVFRVRHEDWTCSFTLSTNHTTHVFIGFFFGDKNNRVLSARNVKRKRKFNWWTDQNKLISNLSQANLTFF